MTIPDATLKAVYGWALRHAAHHARGEDETEQVLIDAATNGILWAQERCTCADSFARFARTAVRRFVHRSLVKSRVKRFNRPEVGALPEQVEGRSAKPTKPTLIADLPDDLAFVVRLYMVDGYTLREIGLLVGRSPNTVDLMLKKAARLLEPEGKAPPRRCREKRLSAR